MCQSGYSALKRLRVLKVHCLISAFIQFSIFSYFFPGPLKCPFLCYWIFVELQKKQTDLQFQARTLRLTPCSRTVLMKRNSISIICRAYGRKPPIAIAVLKVNVIVRFLKDSARNQEIKQLLEFEVRVRLRPWLGGKSTQSRGEVPAKKDFSSFTQFQDLSKHKRAVKLVRRYRRWGEVFSKKTTQDEANNKLTFDY